MASYADNRDYNNLWRIRAGLSSDKKANTDGYYQHRSQYAKSMPMQAINKIIT